jgi:hypothetical protein
MSGVLFGSVIVSQWSVIIGTAAGAPHSEFHGAQTHSATSAP